MKTTVVKLAMAALAMCAVVCVSSCNKQDKTDETDEPTNETVPEGAVDLGLSVYWAECNLGASKAEDYGGFYAWGETTEKHEYSIKNYKWCNYESNEYTKYTAGKGVDNLMQLEPDDDVAHVILGGKWRMPTKAEVEELYAKCTWLTVYDNTYQTVNGYRVQAENGNSIFLPSAGYKRPESSQNPDLLPIHTEAGSKGYYWTSSLNTDMIGFAYMIAFSNSPQSQGSAGSSESRVIGRSIRPVCEK